MDSLQNRDRLSSELHSCNYERARILTVYMILELSVDIAWKKRKATNPPQFLCVASNSKILRTVVGPTRARNTWLAGIAVWQQSSRL
jgi:hypothetical protein